MLQGKILNYGLLIGNNQLAVKVLGESYPLSNIFLPLRLSVGIILKEILLPGLSYQKEVHQERNDILMKK